ncbi:MAG: dihydroxyacetone kinase subunit DhaK, partial [Clostridia bacterium]
IEIGMGVHGEAGSGVRKLCSSKELVSYMMGALVDDLELKSGDQIMALVNNSGATTRMELMIIYNDVVDFLKDIGVEIERNFVGTYVTTQEAQGFSLAICKALPEFVKYYDFKVDSPLF